MAKASKFEISFKEEFATHLQEIEGKYHEAIRKAIDEQLTFTPLAQTRNRKSLRPPGILGALWELRIGPDNRYRVFYQVNEELKEVLVVGIGVKEGSRLFIGGEEHSA